MLLVWLIAPNCKVMSKTIANKPDNWTNFLSIFFCLVICTFSNLPTWMCEVIKVTGSAVYLTPGPVCSNQVSPQGRPGRSYWDVWSVCEQLWIRSHTGWLRPAQRRCTSSAGGRRCDGSQPWPASRSWGCRTRWRRDIYTPESWNASLPGEQKIKEETLVNSRLVLFIMKTSKNEQK